MFEQSGHRVDVTASGVKEQPPARAQCLCSDGIRGVTAVLLLGGDEHVARAELFPATRGHQGRRSESPPRRQRGDVDLARARCGEDQLRRITTLVSRTPGQPDREAGRRKSTRGLLALSGRGVQYVVASP